MSVEWAPEPREEAAREIGGCYGGALDLLVGLLGEGLEGLDGRTLASRLGEVERATRRLEGVAVAIVATADHRELSVRMVTFRCGAG